MNIVINDDFISNGLSLEEAYILCRVKSFEDKGLQYYESSKELAQAMGKSRQAIVNYINALVEKGFLSKENKDNNTRYLSTLDTGYTRNIQGYITDVHYAEEEPKETNRMSDEELRAELMNGIERLKKIRMERELEND